MATLAIVAISAHPSFATTIDNVSAFADNRPSDDLFGIPGLRLSLQATVSDPLGVPNNIVSAVARGVSAGDQYPLSFSRQGGINFFLTFPTYQGQTGQYDFFVTNRQGQTVSRRSHVLDHVRALPIPRDLRVSDFGLTPVLSFDPVPGANRYDLEIFDDQRRGLAFSGTSTTPSLQVPPGVLQFSRTYFLEGRALEFDFAEPLLGVSRLENRSSDVFGFRAFPAVTQAPPVHVFPNDPLGVKSLGRFIVDEARGFLPAVAAQFRRAFDGVKAIFTSGLDVKTKFEGASLALAASSTVIGLAATATDTVSVVAKVGTAVLNLVLSYILEQIGDTVKNVVLTAKKSFDATIAAINATPKTFWSAWLKAASLVLHGLALVAHSLAADPPSNLADVVQPDLVRVSTLVAPGITADRRILATNVLNAYAEAAEYLRVSRISLERYHGALLAGDASAAGQQLLAFLDYLDTYDDVAIQASDLTDELLDRLEADGVENSSYDPGLMAEFQETVAEVGFAQNVLDIFGSLGLTDADIAKMRDIVLEFDTDSPRGRLLGQVRQAGRAIDGITTTAVPHPSTFVMSVSALLLCGAYSVGRRVGLGRKRARHATSMTMRD